MHEQFDNLVATDGVNLAVRKWSSHAAGPWAKALLLIHGIGFHATPYRILAEYLFDSEEPMEDIVIYAMDVRGHGESGGKRGDLVGHDQLVDDVECVLRKMRSENPQAEAFMLGESMGGLFALGFVSERSPGLAGLILVAPALELRAEHLATRNTLRFIGGLSNVDKAAISLGGHLLDISTRDQGFAEFRASDPASLHAVSPHYLWTLWTFNRTWKRSYPDKLRLPLLVIQGGADRLLVPRRAEELWRLAASEDKTFVPIPDACHTLFWDPDSQVVFSAIRSWLRER